MGGGGRRGIMGRMGGGFGGFGGGGMGGMGGMGGAAGFGFWACMVDYCQQINKTLELQHWATKIID